MNKTLILTVEDDRPVRNLIVTTLKTHDYKYLTAENGNEAVIKYNGIDYAVNERGFNIVLIEKESGIVEDSVCFDTHLPDYKCYRRK